MAAAVPSVFTRPVRAPSPPPRRPTPLCLGRRKIARALSLVLFYRTRRTRPSSALPPEGLAVGRGQGVTLTSVQNRGRPRPTPSRRRSAPAARLKIKMKIKVFKNVPRGGEKRRGDVCMRGTSDDRGGPANTDSVHAVGDVIRYFNTYYILRFIKPYSPPQVIVIFFYA